MTSAEPLGDIRVPDVDAIAAARAHCSHLQARHGSLGGLCDLGIWTAGVQGRFPPHSFGSPVLVTFVRGGQETGALDAVCAELARMHDVQMRIVEVSGDTPTAFAIGRTEADREVDAGADLVIPVIRERSEEPLSEAIIGLFSRTDAASVAGHTPGDNDAQWMDRCTAVRDAMRLGRPVMGDPMGVVESMDAVLVAAIAGFLLQSAARATPAVIDGVVPCSAALVASRMSRPALAWWIAASTSHDRALTRGLDHLEIPAITDVGVANGSGIGALTALPILQAAAVVLGN